jgi:hypothetical protein
MKAALRKWLLQALNGKTLSERSEFGLPQQSFLAWLSYSLDFLPTFLSRKK